MEVHLHGELARYAPSAARGTLRVDLATPARVADVLQRFALPRDRSVIIGVGGATATVETALVDGARVDLLTPMAGGSALHAGTGTGVTA